MTKFAKSFAAEGARGAVCIALEESEVTNVVDDIYNTLPGGALGMLPGDFAQAFKVLNERISIEEE